MQRTFSGAIPSIAASCFLRLCVACDAVQQVSWPPVISTMAQDGPIEPCVWTAKSYVALSAFAPFWIASSTLPTLLVASSLETLVARTCSQSFVCSGSSAQFDQVALSLRAALIAPHSL